MKYRYTGRIASAFAFVSLAVHRGIFTESFSCQNRVSDRNSLSALHGMQRVRLRATPTLPENNSVPRDIDGYPRNETRVSDDDASLKNTPVGEASETFFGGIFPTSTRENERSVAIFLLNAVAIIWGTQHAVIKMVVTDSSAAPFTLLRFALAALIAAPYTPGVFARKGTGDGSREDQTSTAWRWGAEMGAWMFLGFAFQAIGLETTTAQRSGFLLYLNVKFVPLFSRVFLGRPISVPTWISAFAAFCGTALLATDGQSIGFNAGDIWSIAAAAASAMYIIRLEKATAEVQDAAQLNAACLWVVATLAAVWTFSGAFQDETSASVTLEQLSSIATSHPLELLYLGGVTTTLANYIQSKGQQYVSPERASIFYSLDPVYGAFFAWLLLGEDIGGIQSLAGASLITVAAATNAFLDFGKSSETSRQSD